MKGFDIVIAHPVTDLVALDDLFQANRHVGAEVVGAHAFAHMGQNPFLKDTIVGGGMAIGA